MDLEYKIKQAKAKRVLPIEQQQSFANFNNTREDSTHGQSPDGQYQNQNDYILCGQRWRSSTQSAKIRPGVDCDMTPYCQIQTEMEESRENH